MPRAHPAPTVASSLAAGRSAHLPSLLQSSGSPSRFQLRTWRPPVEQTCPPQTLSTLDTEDHRSMPAPSSTSLLWMLNQLRLSQSPHTRFIHHKTCSIPFYSSSGSLRVTERQAQPFNRTPKQQ